MIDNRLWINEHVDLCLTLPCRDSFRGGAFLTAPPPLELNYIVKFCTCGESPQNYLLPSQNYLDMGAIHAAELIATIVHVG